MRTNICVHGVDDDKFRFNDLSTHDVDCCCLFFLLHQNCILTWYTNVKKFNDKMLFMEK